MVSVDTGIRRQSYRFKNTDLPFEVVKDGVLSFHRKGRYLIPTKEASPFLLQHQNTGRLVKEVRKKLKFLLLFQVPLQ